jgi:energy-coupling factor transport system permease protein
MFITATNPSEFAASLNRIGIPYTIGYAVALALRYIPDVRNDFIKIRNAQEARGLEMSRKAPLMTRIRYTAAILFPLIFSSLERIDVVSSAMELRGFGKNKKRSWYSGKKLRNGDYVVIILTVLFSVTALFITYRDGNRFYNPFN